MMNENILDANSFETNGLSVDSQAQNFLLKIAFWAKFLGIVSLVFGVLTVFGAFFVRKIFGALGSLGADSSGLIYSTFLTLTYIFIGFLLLFLGYKLVQFASKMKTALSSSNKVVLNESINNLLTVFRFYGIITVLVIIFYALVFIFALVSILAL